MGKFILCSGVQTERPFRFTLTETNVYSIEELCYYLYHNIYVVSEEDFNESLISWLRDEIQMKDIAEKLQFIPENREKEQEAKDYLKDIVVSILCSADYYTEEEIVALIEVMDSIYNLSPLKKRKMKGDNYLKYRNYATALEVYQELLRSEDAAELTPEEYGDILHNQAIAHIHTHSCKDAAKGFKEAFSRNQKKESLDAYFFALKLSKSEEEWEQELVNFSIDEERKQSYIKTVEEVQNRARSLPLYQSLGKLQILKENGKVSEYYQEIDDLMNRWKQEYRREIK